MHRLRRITRITRLTRLTRLTLGPEAPPNSPQGLKTSSSPEERTAHLGRLKTGFGQLSIQQWLDLLNVFLRRLVSGGWRDKVKSSVLVQMPHAGQAV